VPREHLKEKKTKFKCAEGALGKKNNIKCAGGVLE